MLGKMEKHKEGASVPRVFIREAVANRNHRESVVSA